MKITKDTLKQMIAEEIANEKGLKAKIRKAHKEEGGAAGMDALEKHTKASAKDIKAAVKDMDDVGQHKDGDYIQGDDKEIEIAKEVQRTEEDYELDEVDQEDTERELAAAQKLAGGFKKDKKKSKRPDPDAINPDFDRDYDEYGRVYQESKKDLLKRIVAEELAKMEIETVLKEEEGESEIGESDFEDLLRAVAEKRVEIEYV